MKRKKIVLSVITSVFILFCVNSFADETILQGAQSDETAQKKLFLLVETFGMFARSADIEGEDEYGTYITARVGLLYKLIPGAFDVFIKGGASPALSGDPWNTFIMFDLGFTLQVKKVLFGVGVEYNNQIKDGGRETNFWHPFFVGIEVYNTGSIIGSILIEGHVPMRYWVGSPTGYNRWHKFNLGFRVLF